MSYSEKVLDHFHHPRHAGEIAHADAVVEASNPVCGDVLKLWAVLREGRLTEVSFKAAGCVPAIACGSWLAEWMQGKPLKALRELPAADIESALGGLPPASKHASVLAADALKRLAGRLASSK
ncbi:MAG: iron-sulfur cluster assembly scaffold protein [Terriglobia bacterium]